MGFSDLTNNLWVRHSGVIDGHEIHYLWTLGRSDTAAAERSKQMMSLASRSNTIGKLRREVFNLPIGSNEHPKSEFEFKVVTQ